MNILNNIVLVSCCLCHVLITSLISFVSYIIAKYITVLLYDVHLSHLNKDYFLTYLNTTMQIDKSLYTFTTHCL